MRTKNEIIGQTTDRVELEEVLKLEVLIDIRDNLIEIEKRLTEIGGEVEDIGGEARMNRRIAEHNER